MKVESSDWEKELKRVWVPVWSWSDEEDAWQSWECVEMTKRRASRMERGACMDNKYNDAPCCDRIIISTDNQ